MDSISPKNNTTLLKVDDLSVTFGRLKAITNLTFQIQEGELFGLIGPNGAGKTTVFNAVTGSVPLTGGEIRFADELVSGLKPHQIVHKGIVRVFQAATFFPKTQVGTHVMTGLHCRTASSVGSVVVRTPFCRREEAHNEEKVDELLKFADLTDFKQCPAADLTWAGQKRLMVATALATGPKLILLDEPVAGMNADEVREMIDLIKMIRERGITVFIIEHNMKFMTQICDRIMVINLGQNLTEGTPEFVCQDPRVIEAYLGCNQA